MRAKSSNIPKKNRINDQNLRFSLVLTFFLASVFAADFLAPVLVFAAVFLAAVFAPEVFLAVFFFVVAEVFFAAILKHFPFKNNCQKSQKSLKTLSDFFVIYAMYYAKVMGEPFIASIMEISSTTPPKAKV